ncbi:trichohyalin-like isoform X3 [Haliotis rufescens]|uniref:trichohyalin-like isoform X3 n=1 Tax=Haliotis rufescens TaxID=6454 RepID=UPI00201E9332|nr:trichohyalin-like isoform X3 [Haliotis rufescens]
MDGTDADGEWSDDDGVKSGSVTALSDNEPDDIQTSLKITTTITTSPGNHKIDPVHAILDKIDAELGAIATANNITTFSQPQSVKISPFPTVDRFRLEAQGVVFDTTDELNQRDKLVLGHIRGGSSDRDTGVGTGSVQDDAGSEHKRIVGSAQVYSDVGNLTDVHTDGRRGAKLAAPLEDDHRGEDGHSDLDSLAAQQIDEKFKEIMRKKRGGYLDDLKARIPRPGSDRDTVNSEEGVVTRPTGPADLPPHPNHVSVLSRPPKLKHHLPRPYTGYASDLESVKTEDFESRFQDLMIGQTSKDTSSKLKTLSKKLANRESRETQVQSNMNHSGGFSYPKPTEESKSFPLARLFSSFQNKPANDLTLRKSPYSSLPAPDSRSTTDIIKLPRPRSVSPARLRPEKRIVSVYEEDSVDETCREIERETARIRQEMERERRSHSVSPTNHLRSSSTSPVRAGPIGVSSPETMRKVYTTSRDGAGKRQTQAEEEEREVLTQEIKTLRQALHASRLELREAETSLKGTREKSEDARTQLMLTEFKRTTAMKDLERVMEDMERKKNEARNFESQIKVKQGEVRDIQSIASVKEELRAVQEVNSDLRVKVRSSEGMQLERDELVRQLEQTKDELFNEQKQSRMQKEELQDEVETLMGRMEETQGSQDDVHNKLMSLEAAYRTMEKCKDEIIQEKSREQEEMKTRYKRESRENKRMAEQEKKVLQQEVLELNHKLGQVQDELNKKDDSDLRVRDQLIELQQELAKEKDARDAIADDHKRVLQTLRKETDCAIMKLRESMFLEKQQALEMCRSEMEQEKRDASSRADERMSVLMAEHSTLLAEKNEEVCRLQDLIKGLEEERQQTEFKVQEEITLQVRDAVGRERQVLETEKEWFLRREKEAITMETKQRLNELTVEVARERQLKEDLLQQVQVLRNELDTQRHQNRQATKDKVFAVARAKDMVRDQNSAELERIKDKVKQDNHREMERLREQIKSMEEEVRQLKAEKQQMNRSERDTTSALERAERTVVNEVNEECRRSAGVLGIAPRRVNQGSVNGTSSPVPFSSLNSGKYRTPITVALANLRACNEELRGHVADLKQELETHRSLLQKTQRDKDESLDNLRRDLEKEKNIELESLKERLFRDHVDETNKASLLRQAPTDIIDMKRNIHHWKEETTDKYVRKFEEELNKQLEIQQRQHWNIQRELRDRNERQQKEIEKLEKEIHKVALTQDRYVSPVRSTLQHKFQGDNSLQRSKYFSTALSVPDLSNPAHYRQTHSRSVSPTREHVVVTTLEERFKTAEKDAALAEQHTRQNQAALSQKMTEMNKLQNTLSNQTKELMDLERAYSHLHRQYNQRPSSPTRMFTASR